MIMGCQFPDIENRFCPKKCQFHDSTVITIYTSSKIVSLRIRIALIGIRAQHVACSDPDPIWTRKP